MHRSIAFVKTVHAAIFLLFSVLLVILLFEVIVDRITVWSWIALALLLVEGVVLFFNDWNCPLTVYAEELGSPDGQVADLFFPTWIASRVFHIYGVLIGIATIGLVIRLIS